MLTLSYNHSVISSQALASVLPDLYDIGKAVECRFLNNGLNDTYIYTTDEQSYAVRVYKANWRKRQDIDFELAMLHHLAGRSNPVSSPIPMKSGGFSFMIDAPEGERAAAVFTFAPGGYADNEESSKLYGKEVAKLHREMDTFQTGHDRFIIDIDHLLYIPLQTIRPFLKQRPDDIAYLEAVADLLARRLKEAAPHLEWGLCHGDLHGGNVYFHEGSLTHFDFDCSGYGWRAYDIAVFLWAKVRARGKEAFNNEKWPLFLEAYQNEKSLAKEDLEAIPLFVAAREIWLMGLHTGFAEVWGGWMDDNYFNTNIKFLKDWCEHHCLENC